MIDVAITGGGLGGLTTAIALRKACPHLNVKVFEKVNSFKTAGGLLTMNINTIRTLRAIDQDALDHVLNALAPRSKIMKTITPTGEVLGSISVEAAVAAQMQKYGEARLGSGPWSSVQKALYSALPEGTVVTGRSYESLQVTEAGTVKAKFRVSGPDAEATGADAMFEEVECRLLVGADGLNSRVREGYLAKIEGLEGNKHQFVEGGLVQWRALVSRSDVDESMLPPELSVGSSMVVQGGPNGFGLFWRGDWVDVAPEKDLMAFFIMAPYSVLEKKGIRVTMPDGPTGHPRLTVASTGEAAGPGGKAGESSDAAAAHSGFGYDEKATKGAQAKKVLQTFLMDWPESIQKIIGATKESRILQHGLHFRLFDSAPVQWGEGPVTLLGDSFHPSGPAGHGWGQATEDAHQLALSVRDLGATPAALRDYERKRGERVAFVCNSAANVFMNEFFKSEMVNTAKANIKAFTEKKEGETVSLTPTMRALDEKIYEKNDWEPLATLEKLEQLSIHV